jgi:hypothetical protein
VDGNRIHTTGMVLTQGGVYLITALLPIPVSAAHETWATRARERITCDCPLERVQLQYVRCDTLTGAGVTPPLWISQRP